MEKIYKAEVRVKGDKKIIVVESSYNTKQEFIDDLRGNGYLVDPSRVKTKDEFDKIVNNTNGDEWNWHPRKYRLNPKIRAEDFITDVLHMEIERPRTKKGNISLTTYSSGRQTFTVPLMFDINSDEIQRILWHEIGHYFDKAHIVIFGRGKSNIQAKAVSGRYSDDFKEYLIKYKGYLQINRQKFIIDVNIKYKNKIFKSIDEINSSDMIQEHKNYYNKKYYKYLIENRIYTSQSIEIFADGFAEYMLDPAGMRKNAPEMASVYKSIVDLYKELGE